MLISVPKNGVVSSSSRDCFSEVDRPGCRKSNAAVPRGILKHLSASSSTGPVFLCNDLQSPVSPDSPPENWIDRKQVRFSSPIGQSRVEWQDGKELGEHSLLDIDSITASEEGNNSVSTCKPLLRQSQVDSKGGELCCKNKANLQQQDVSHHKVLGGKSFT